ncbi:hypothetical protein Tco_0071436 [Tanacetum coccineum]
MEILTLIIRRRVHESDLFTYHRYCSKLDLVNLCFADDLFLFAYGDTSLASVIMADLDEFKLASGLTPSLPKSTAYFCGVTNHVKHAILQILPFEEGRLPVKYLGALLVSSRLIFRDCKELLEKVQIRVDDWKNKSLSIAGRLQLVNSILGSLHVFWASVFMLPTRILLDIEQIMRGFLWCQGKLGGGKAKVAWNVVWKLLSRKESLWVEWIHVYKLRGRSFWDIPYRGNMTWGWRNVLKLRPLIREFIWKKLGNGLTTSVWFDRWCIQSPLADLISSRDIFREGFNKETKGGDGLVCSFSADTVWNTIRARGTKVSWYDAVWFSCCIPKHAVHLWLVIRRRLKTQDTLRHWDNMIYALVTCSLCETQPDSHDHLFFECPFSQQVWNQVKGAAGLASSNASIYDIIDDIIPFAARKTSKSVIAKLVVAATSYFIWQERNGRLFKNMKRTVNQVVECIMNTVRLKLMSCRLKKSRSACDIVKAWKLAVSVIFYMAQQIILVAQRVPKFQGIGRCNNYAMFQSIPCSPECKIVGQILLDHPLSYALTATADVPSMYLQQFWKTVSKVLDSKDTIRFKLDTQEIVYTVDMFRDILKLPVETPDNPFVAP